MTLQRLSAAHPEPLWSQAERALLDAVRSGRFAAGERLPSEHELAADLGLHRHTIRRAVEALVERGVLEIRRGRGTYLAPERLPYRLGPRSRFTENVTAAGQSPSMRIISTDVMPAGEDAAHWLQVPIGTPLVNLSILRLADERPLVLARHSMPEARFPDYAKRLEEIRSITRTYASFGVVGYTRHATKMSARLPDFEESAALAIARGTPLLTWTSVNVDPDGVPMNLDESVFVASRVDIIVEGA